jgi:hypothetical protein
MLRSPKYASLKAIAQELRTRTVKLSSLTLLSKLVGGNGVTKGEQSDSGPRKISERIAHLLQDDAAQLELIDPKLRDVLKEAPCYDKSPNGSGPFGLCETNPIPTNGPIGELAYLSKLVTLGGERILFHRVDTVNDIDIFEAVTFSGSEWFILFLDMHHPKKSRNAPEGFTLSPTACLLSGFHHLCEDFPYDFMQMRQREDLRSAYMPTWDILRGIESKAFERSAIHKAQLERVLAPPERSTLVDVDDADIALTTQQYYSLIERAVSAQASNTAASREAIYSQARSVLLAQMLGLTPPASEAVIMREQRALDAAIQRLEEKLATD